MYAETEGRKARLLGKEAKNRRVRFFLSGLRKVPIWVDAARASDHAGHRASPDEKGKPEETATTESTIFSEEFPMCFVPGNLLHGRGDVEEATCGSPNT